VAEYKGYPFKDSVFPGGPQVLPGRLMCAYYDFGGEGVAYHDTDPVNHGSGGLNPADGSYLHEFRKDEGVDTSYVKSNGIDDHPYNFANPEPGMLYVGWTEAGEWLKYTVDVQHSGIYEVSLFYTSNRGGAIAISVNDTDAAGPIRIQSTFRAEDPIAWRQWHHWNKMEGIARIPLEKGKQVLTLHTVAEGNMNYAYLDFVLLPGV
jgi:hypothetical protein